MSDHTGYKIMVKITMIEEDMLFNIKRGIKIWS
jgi:hypothetical protein